MHLQNSMLLLHICVCMCEREKDNKITKEIAQKMSDINIAALQSSISGAEVISSVFK